MNAFLQSLKNLGPMRIAAMVAVAVGMIGFIIFVAARVSTPQLELLYGDIEQVDSGRLIQKLESLKVPYEIRGNGQQIFVPSDQVGKLRLQLAEQALPSSNVSVGYEIFDKQDPLGSTSFMQNLNLVRALEGELSRTIRQVQGVKSARVHLVMPRREVFSRDSQEPSASIALRMSGGRLNKQQVSAIQHLVAAAVPKLQPSRISIVDDRGTLLSRGFESDKEMMSVTAEEMRLGYEQRLARQIEDLLEKTVGAGKVRTEIRADMDFDRLIVNEEKFDPDSQVVRSTRTITEALQGQDSESLPVSVGQNLPDANAATSGATKTSNKENRNDELVNYEISKKVINQVRETGVVKRLSVAVLIDGFYTGETGNRTYNPRKQEEIEQLATLVRSAIGYDSKRGDAVEVINMRFAGAEEPEPEKPITFLFGLEKSDLMKMAEILVLSVVAILVILLVVRPLVTRAFESMPAAGEAGRRLLEPGGAPALAGPGMPQMAPGVPMDEEMESLDELIDIDKVEGRVKASSIKKIGEIIEKHPEEALAILRTWMYQET